MPIMHDSYPENPIIVASPEIETIPKITISNYYIKDNWEDNRTKCYNYYGYSSRSSRKTF